VLLFRLKGFLKNFFHTIDEFTRGAPKKKKITRGVPTSFKNVVVMFSSLSRIIFFFKTAASSSFNVAESYINFFFRELVFLFHSISIKGSSLAFAW